MWRALAVFLQKRSVFAKIENLQGGGLIEPLTLKRACNFMKLQVFSARFQDRFTFFAEFLQRISERFQANSLDRQQSPATQPGFTQNCPGGIGTIVSADSEIVGGSCVDVQLGGDACAF
jgi:hypothetical protein